MRLLIKNKKGLVPIKKLVQKKGKPFMQTFYVRPDQVPEKPKMIAAPEPVKMLPSPEPSWKGPLGDERAYILLETGDKKEALRIPETAILKRESYKGYNFVAHVSFNHSNRKFEDDAIDVTEVTTGKRLSRMFGIDPDKAIEQAKEMIDAHEAELPDKLAKSPKITDVPSEEFTENITFTPKVKTSEEDYAQIAAHIYENVLDRGPLDPDEYDDMEEYEQESLDQIKGWLKRHGDLFYREDNIHAEMNEYTSDEWFVMEIALEGDMDLDDARDTAQCLSEIQDALKDTGYDDLDSVKDWWDYNGNPVLDPYSIPSGDTDYETGVEVEQSEVLSTMVANNWDFAQAEQWVEEYLQEMAEELHGTEMDYDDTLQDRDGQMWSGSDINAVGAWVNDDYGSTVSTQRDYCREADEARREGRPLNVVSDMASAVEDHMVSYPGEMLYRRTPNIAKWAEAEVGTTVPLGVASFTTSEAAIHSGAKVVMVMRHGDGGTSESKKIMGVNINELGEDVQEAGYDSDKILEYRHEQEFVVRAPSVRVVAQYPKGGDLPLNATPFGKTFSHIVVVEPAEMDLIKALQNKFSPTIEELYETFNEPLSERTQKTPPSFSEWAVKKVADAPIVES